MTFTIADNSRPLNEAEKANFATLQRAAANGDLALLSGADAETGEHRAIICAVAQTEDGDYQITPFGHLAPGDPFEAYLPPAPIAEEDAHG